MIALLALHAALVADSLMGPGVSLELARYRAERVANVRYDLTLDVTRRDTVLGNVRVSFTAKKPISAVEITAERAIRPKRIAISIEVPV